jgi:hypothetical protein
MSDDKILLSVSTERGPDQLDRLTSELTRDLASQPGISARPMTADAASGSRGVDVPLLGQIVLMLVGGTGIGPALVGCLRAYIERDRSMSFTFKRSDGTKLTFSGSNLRPSETESALSQLQAFLQEKTSSVDQTNGE